MGDGSRVAAPSEGGSPWRVGEEVPKRDCRWSALRRRCETRRRFRQNLHVRVAGHAEGRRFEDIVAAAMRKRPPMKTAWATNSR